MSEPSSDKPENAAQETDRDALLRAWCAEVAAALGVQDLEFDLDSVLGLAGVAAHSVVRPAAPLTTFLAAYAAGLAVGAGESEPAEALRASIATALAAAKAHGAPGTEG